jgi:hypothetical protein
MSRHFRKTEKIFDLEFRPSAQATAHGGQLAVAGLAKEYGLWEKLKAYPALDPRRDQHKGFDVQVYVAAFVFGFCSGGKSLADSERLDQDQALKDLLGIKRFPDQSALGEWLRHIGAEGVQALRSLGRDFCAWALPRAEPGRVRHGGALESFFDDTQIEVEGKRFEGAKINYEGNLALSWQTLWVGPFLADAIMGSPSAHKEAIWSGQAGEDVSAYLPMMVEANRSLWEGGESYLYADSASSAGKYLETIDAAFSRWSVSYNKWTGPLEQGAEQLPEASWSAVALEAWRDGSEHETQYNWLRYQPSGCAAPKLFAVVRHRRGGEELFWRYHFVATKEHAHAPQPQGAFERHRLKGDKERAFSELLSDFDLHHPPCHSLHANNAYYLLGALAYNLLQALKVIYLPVEHQPKRIRTLLHHLLLIPVEIKRHARRMKAVFFAPAGWLAWWKGFLGDLLPRCRQVGVAAAG